jgi:hypothetical protein
VGPNNYPTGTTAYVSLEKYYYDLPNVTSESNFFRFNSGIANPDQYNTNSPSQAVSWGTQVPNPTADGVVNSYGFVWVGDNIYTISYELGRVTKIAGTSGAIIGADNHGPIGSVNPLDAYAVGIGYWNNQVWVAFNATNSTGSTYNNGVVTPVTDYGTYIKLDTTNELPIAMNAVNLVVAGDFMYVPCVGGMQVPGGQGANSMIYRIKLSSGSPTSEVAFFGATGTELYDFHGVAVGEKYAVVLTYNYDPNYNADWKVWKMATGAFNSSVNQPITNFQLVVYKGTAATGYFWLIVYEAANKHFWIFTGNPLRIYPHNLNDRDAEAPKDFSLTDLYPGGNITGFNVTIDSTSANVGPVTQSLRPAVAHLVALGKFPSQAAYIEDLKQQ